jgi:hypothetical protein
MEYLRNTLYKFLSTESSLSNLRKSKCYTGVLLGGEISEPHFAVLNVASITRVSHITHSARYIPFVQCLKNLP